MLETDLQLPTGRVHMVVRAGDGPEFCFHGMWNARDMQCIDEALGSVQRDIRLNFSACTGLDSGAMAILMSLVRRALEDGYTLQFCYPDKTMQRILELNGMDTAIVCGATACAPEGSAAPRPSVN